MLDLANLRTASSSVDKEASAFVSRVSKEVRQDENMPMSRCSDDCAELCVDPPPPITDKDRSAEYMGTDSVLLVGAAMSFPVSAKLGESMVARPRLLT